MQTYKWTQKKSYFANCSIDIFIKEKKIKTPTANCLSAFSQIFSVAQERTQFDAIP